MHQEPKFTLNRRHTFSVVARCSETQEVVAKVYGDSIGNMDTLKKKISMKMPSGGDVKRLDVDIENITLGTSRVITYNVNRN